MTPEEESILTSIATSVPKCELHLHLDGSLSPGFICRRLLSRQIPLPEGVSPEGDGLRAYLHHMKAQQVVKNGNRAEKNKNWGVFDFCNQVLQTEEELVDGTFDVLQHMHAEKVRLCEIRFCPSLHTLEGLSHSQAVWAVVRGFRRAATVFGMVGGVILCGLRSYSAEDTKALAELSGLLLEETGGVVLGYDIAGDEGSFAITEHLCSLQCAAERGVGVTCHAGEWPVNERFGTGSLDNLRVVLQLQTPALGQTQEAAHVVGRREDVTPVVSRVGHGIQLVLDHDLLKVIGEQKQGRQQICFECCLTANVGWKVAAYQEHPVRKMVQAGVKVALCCDNLLLSGAADRAPSPINEIIHFVRDVGMSYVDLAAVLTNSAHASFVFKAQRWEEDKVATWLRDFEHDVHTTIETHKTSGLPLDVAI